MKNTLICLALAGGCSSKLPVEAPKTDFRSMSLIGRYGLGHACPADGMVYTAAHVSELWFPGGQLRGVYYRFQQGDRLGVVRALISSPYEDMAAFAVEQGEPIYYPRAEPVDGQDIWWYEFVDPLRPVVKRGRIVGLLANHIAFYPSPHPGSSGGCLFNAEGAIGVVTWSKGKYGIGPRLPAVPPVR